MCPAYSRGVMTAGPDVVRGSGPNQNHGLSRDGFERIDLQNSLRLLGDICELGPIRAADFLELAPVTLNSWHAGGHGGVVPTRRSRQKSR